MLVRHAEKPDDMGTVLGVTPEGSQDPESLVVRGWQRAGALVHLFSGEARDPRYAAIETPDVIFATGVGHGSHSKRPWQTAQPLAEALVARTGNSGLFVTSYLRDQEQNLVADVVSRSGVVLISWHHEAIPGIVALLPNGPDAPTKWPGSRFDMIWILTASGSGWTFTQVPQLALAGDSTALFS
jgi:hypothetical protein